MGAAVINFCTEIVAIDDLPFVPIRLNLYEIVCDKREDSSNKEIAGKIWETEVAELYLNKT